MNPDTPATTQILTVIWIPESQSLRNKAEHLAQKLHLPLVDKEAAVPADIVLSYHDKGLKVQFYGELEGSLAVDFLSDSLTYRRKHGGGVKQPLARAVGIKSGIRPTILDATAGLGRDSLVLASLGCQVTMVERSPLLAALLEDGLERAEKNAAFQKEIGNRIKLIQGDATRIIPTMPSRPDVIYLDPMYPHRGKSALNKQEMRLVRRLVGDDSDAGQVLALSLQHAGERVVVKRPKGAPLVSDISPSHEIVMKNSRYDVYMSVRLKAED